MELRKTAMSVAGRTRVLLPGQGIAYQLHLVRYTLIRTAQTTDNAGFRLALSVRSDDQVEDVATLSADIMARDPGLFALWSALFEAPTDVGLMSHELNKDIVFNPPYTVPYLAAALVVSAALGTLGIEVYFDRVRLTKTALAQLVIEAGGQART